MKGQDDLSEMEFGRLTVIAYEGRRGYMPYWICKCSCGNVKSIRSYSLIRGATESCGCLNKEIVSRDKKTHGMCQHPLYEVWGSMIKRCYNEKSAQYKYYGGRGILVSDEWRDANNFLEWAISRYEDGLELDRRDNDKGYSPDNCHFTTSSINSCNRRLLSSNKSGYSGVRLMRSGKFLARISSIDPPCNGKYKELGRFHTIEQAVQARNNFIREHGLNNKIQEIK